MNTLIIVSGGDAPGINAALWQYTRLAARRGDRVIGARGGLAGVLRGDLLDLPPNLLLPFAAMPGAFLASSREPALAADGAREALLAVLGQRAVDGVVLFGGDGTLRHVLPLLGAWGVPSVGVPTTIDNDVPGTDYTLGFDSACNFAYHAIDGARATAAALPGRLFMLETLGGNTGCLALAVAHGAGAHAVLLPEYPYDPAWLSARLRAAVAADGWALLVLSEGVKAARTLADDLYTATQIRVRDIRLGHAQRGGTPTHLDRIMGADMAALAYDALRSGVRLGVTVVRGGVVSLHEGTLQQVERPLPDRQLYERINGLTTA
jgi:6-phosphofructokinase 1